MLLGCQKLEKFENILNKQVSMITTIDKLNLHKNIVWVKSSFQENKIYFTLTNAIIYCVNIA